MASADIGQEPTSDAMSCGSPEPATGDVSPIAVSGPSARFGRSLAVVIGIDSYGEGLSPLRSAVADAKAIAQMLHQDHGFETWCVIEMDAQLQSLRTLLHERIPSALGPADRLLFYFAGHGTAVDGDRGPAGYLIPAGARREDSSGFLPMHEVHDALSKVPVRHALIILDCCFAGTFRWSSLRDVSPTATPIFRERFDSYVESPAWQVLTSASGDQRAFDVLANDRGESSDGHSPFARALLDGLAGAADYTHDNLITADELALFVRERVAPAAESMGRRQVPQLLVLDRHCDGQFVFQVPRSALALVSAPALDENANPYRGWASFREQDRAVFFGRDVVVKQLHDRVKSRQLTVIVGPSGCGKSSLVHAGLVPALRAERWTVLPSHRPGAKPLEALQRLICAVHPESNELAGLDPVTGWSTAVAARETAHPGEPWLVFVDQIEDLFTHRAAERDRIAFLGALASALEAAPGMHLVLTVRADVEHEFHPSALAPAWTDARFVMTEMSRAELREAILRPAHAAVLHFEPAHLVERLIDDVTALPAPLPVLSFALSELYGRCWQRWQAGTRDRALREADHDIGGVSRVLIARATALQDELVARDAAYAITMRNLFSDMVATVGGKRVRQRLVLDALDNSDADDQREAEALQRLHEDRLIALGVDHADSRYAEPMHDELVRGWTPVSWVDEIDPATRGALDAVRRAARSWHRSSQPASLLWTDPRVELLQKVVHERPQALNAREARFVQRCVALRRRGRMLRLGGVVATIAVLAMVGFAVRERQRATSTAIVATSSAQTLARSLQETGRRLVLDGHPFQALPYLVAAGNAGNVEPPLRMVLHTASRGLSGVPPLQHGDSVNRAAFSPDGSHIVTAGVDGFAWVWDAATGQRITSVRHDGVVVSAAFSPDGKWIVTASQDRTAQVWDAKTGQPRFQRPLEHKDFVQSAVFSPDGAHVVTASFDHSARIWDARTGALEHELAHDDAVWSAAFSPDGTRVVTASRDHTVRIWDVATGLVGHSLKHNDSVSSAVFSRDGARVVTASRDVTARVWDAISGGPVGSPLEHQDSVVSAVFDPSGRYVVTASYDKTARIWDASSGSPMTPPLEHQGNVNSAAFSPEGARVVTASSDGTARLWDVETGRMIAPVLEHAGPVTSAMFSRDGTRVVTASDDGTARVWDTTGDGSRVALALGGEVRSAAFSRDGQRVVTASGDNTARICDTATGAVVGSLVHQATVETVAYGPDDRVVTTSEDRTVRIWDTATGRILAAMKHDARVTSVTFSADGARIVTATGDDRSRWDDTLRIWDASTGLQLPLSLEYPGRIVSGALSPDRTHLVTLNQERTARVWDAVTGQAITGSLEQGGVTRMAFSPDGTLIVTAHEDRTARVWDAATGQPVVTLGHPARVAGASFAPDGARILTISDDRAVRVWDANTGLPLALPIPSDAPIVNAAFTADGARIVVADPHRVRMWDVALDLRPVSEWATVANQSPYILKNGVLTLRPTDPGAEAPVRRRLRLPAQ